MKHEDLKHTDGTCATSYEDWRQEQRSDRFMGEVAVAAFIVAVLLVALFA